MSGKVVRPKKTKYLATIQELLNASSKQQVKELVDAIEKGIATDQIRQAALGERYRAHKAEIKHIQKDWYDKKTNHWEGSVSPEKSLRKSMVSALKVLLEQDGDKKPDVDFWWVANVASIKKAEFVPLHGPKQLTVLLLSPPPQAAKKRSKPKTKR